MTDRAVGPDISGLTFIEHLGSGGYSDVYLYEQRKPRMRVAVKVLTDARLSEAELGQFAAEAETMAELADHPFIVQVFTTGTTDDERPYLVMKYYPPPNLGQRAATERFTVADVLKTGIQIASAVETAHRAGILHRDIKPANILISQYGEPGLADFGIAGKAADSEGDDDIGVSIPWSPPEVLSGASNGSVASDVYSLAATLWHLLAGRSPFEVPGGDNSSRALTGRILRSAAPATGRADAPQSLERLLRQALSKQPEQRPGSALEFARGLQSIEQEQRYARTEIVVDGTIATSRPAQAAPPPASTVKASPEQNARFAPGPQTSAQQSSAPAPPPTTVRPARPAGPTQPPPTPVSRFHPPASASASAAPAVIPAPAESPATRARPARPVEPPAAGSPPSTFAPPSPAAQGTRMRPASPTAREPRQRHGLSASAEVSPTTRRPAAPSEPGNEAVQPEAASRRGVKTPVVVLVAAVIVVAAVVIGIVVMAGGSKHPSANETPSGPLGTDQAGMGDAADVSFPTVTPSYDTGTKTLTFTWTKATGTDVTPKYAYWLKDASGAAQNSAPNLTTQTFVRVATAAPANECIEVGVVLTDGTVASNQQRTCGQ